LVVQNPCFEGRSAFLLDKLRPALVAQRVHVRYIPVIFLVAYEPEAALRDNVKHAVEQRLSQVRPTPGSPSVVEDSFCRLLYILAHHPDWDDSQSVPTLELFAPYIEFYISCVCMAQNVSLLFCYAGELKAYRNRAAADGVSKDIPNDVFTHRLYILSELAQYLLREKSMSSNWPVNVYPARRAKAPTATRLGTGKRIRSKSGAAAGAQAGAQAGAVALGSPKSGKRKKAAAGKPSAKAKGKARATHSNDMDDDSDDMADDDEAAEDVEMSSVAETSDEGDSD
ncbi:Sister chromatid cohesion protein pds5, partial [Coemansia sp. RSA 2673]